MRLPALVVGVSSVVAVWIAACSVADVPASVDAGNEALAPADAADSTLATDSSDAAMFDAADAAPNPCDADTTSDPTNCGSCGHHCSGDDAGGSPYCASSMCATTTDITKLPGYWTVSPAMAGGAVPFIEMWTDSVFQGAANLDLKTGTSKPWLINGSVQTAGIDLSERPNAVIVNGVSTSLISHREGPKAWDYKTPQFLDWDFGAGCCSFDADGVPPIDAANGYWYFGPRRVNLATGKTITTMAVGPTFPVAYNPVSGNLMYVADPGQLWRGDFATLAWDWHVSVGSAPNAQLGPPVILSNGDVAVASPAGTLSVFKGTKAPNTAWTKSFTAFSQQPLLPITVATGPVVNVAPSGLVLESTADPALVAYDAATGSVAWTYNAGGRVDDVVAGEGGIVYVFISAEAKIYGLDVATGAVKFTYTKLPSDAIGGAEMLLRSGRIYVMFKGQVTSFTVPSTGFDPTSSWPTRFHDSQRTNCATSPMTY